MALTSCHCYCRQLLNHCLVQLSS